VWLEPTPLRSTPGVDGELSLDGVDNGLRGQLGARLDVVPTWLPTVSVRLEANGSKGASVSTPTYVLGNTGSETLNAAATVLWQDTVLALPMTVKLSYRRYQASLGICNCLKVNTPAELAAATQADQPANAEAWTTSYAIERPRQQLSHDLALARANIDLGALGAVIATYAFQLDSRDEFDHVRGSVQAPQYAFSLLTHSVDAAWLHGTLHWGRLRLTGQVGVHGELQQHRYQGLQLIPNFSRLQGGVFLLERLVLENVAGLGDVEWVAGVRADGLLQSAYLTQSAYEAQLRRRRLGPNDCTLNDDVARCDKNLPAMSITLGARMAVQLGDVRDALRLQADVSSATRFPDVDELYLGGRAPSMPVFGLGTGSLGTERTQQLSLGAELRLPMAHLDGGVFVSRINDYISFGPELTSDGKPAIDVIITGTYPRFSSQAIEATMAGVDGQLTLAPEEVVSAAVQVAVLRGWDFTHGGYLPFVPPPRARIDLMFTVPQSAWSLTNDIVHDVKASSTWVMVSEQTRTDARSDFVPPAAGYTLWHANVVGQVDVLGVPVELGVEVRNILNQRYRDQLSLMRFFADQPGREVWLRSRVMFSTAWL
jgi:iron complex outermembrane recepter protein